jgi:hypothetical protein
MIVVNKVGQASLTFDIANYNPHICVGLKEATSHFHGIVAFY